MNKFRYIYFVFLLSLYSCDNNKVNESRYEPFLEVDEEYVINAFDFDMSEMGLRNKFGRNLTLEKKSHVNRHDPDIVDTIISCDVLSGNNHFEIYKVLNKELLVRAVICSEEIVLKNHVQVGMSIDEFNNNMNLEAWPGTIKICDLEDNIYFVFYFNNFRLDSIIYCNKLD